MLILHTCFLCHSIYLYCLYTVNILEELSIQDHGFLTNRTTSDGRSIYLINQTFTGPASNTNWLSISRMIGKGFGFIFEWLPVRSDPFTGQIIAINKGMDNEFSIRIEDSPESFGNMLRQRMIVNIPQASDDVQFPLFGNTLNNSGVLWQYGVTYGERVFRFYFNCNSQHNISGGNPGFFINNSMHMIELGDPNGAPFLVCTYI